jgi:hypothetical protein
MLCMIIYIYKYIYIYINITWITLLHWQSLLKGVEKSGDQSDGDSDAIAAQVCEDENFIKQ